MKSVFIIDDERHSIINLEKSIKWENFNCKISKTFQNSLEAEKAIISYKPDLIFIDISMPKLNGLDLIKNVRQMNYKGDIVVVSGYDEFEYAQRAIKYKVIGYCLKPIIEDDVNKILHSFKENPGNINLKYSEIFDFIDLNIYKNLSIDDICTKFSISRSYISKIFRSTINKNFKQYVTEKRIGLAIELLKTTNFTIQEISEKVGYDDYFYFSKKFKDEVGIPPKKFRRNYEDEIVN
ncbi:MAG: response regulator [Lachnospirales bacterium]